MLNQAGRTRAHLVISYIPIEEAGEEDLLEVAWGLKFALRGIEIEGFTKPKDPISFEVRHTESPIYDRQVQAFASFDLHWAPVPENVPVASMTMNQGIKEETHGRKENDHYTGREVQQRPTPQE